MAHARPGKSFMEMLELILRNQRRPNNPFSPQLLMAIFWEEGFFTNKRQEEGTAIGFGQVEPAELDKLTTQQARDNGYEVPGVSTATRSLSDDLAVTVPSCMLLHLYHSRRERTPEEKADNALRAYAGVYYTKPSRLTPAQRLDKIRRWRCCERALKKLPFSEYRIVNYPGQISDLENRYMDALHLARSFDADYVFSRSPELVRFRDLLFPRNWFLPGFGTPARATVTTRPGDRLFETIAEGGQVRLEGRGHFHVLARPGEQLPELAPGDLLLRQPPGATRPRIARIASAAAEPDELFFEGVMAERGPAGLYVEVGGNTGYPVARRVGDRRGRVAERTLVLRRSAPMSVEADEEFAEESNAQFRRQRDELVASIGSWDFVWREVPLTGGYRIQVSEVVAKTDFFVPVTAAETRALARQFGALPLSRAVVDQAHNAAKKVPRPNPPDNIFDFVTYTERLKKTPYYLESGLSSGAHKLWVISSRGPAVNYGFYIPRRRIDPVRCGPYLDAQYNVIQGLGTKHNGAHWDYSQLLQLMKDLRDSNGQPVDLRQALLDRNPAVWDEAQPPARGSLP